MEPVGKLAVLDYGVGNMRSVANALNRIGVNWEVAKKASDLPGSTRLLLPGVGAFGSAMDLLDQSGLKAGLLNAAQRGVPVLGICLGMQLLSEGSEESPGVAGLGLIPAATRAVTSDHTTNTGFHSVSSVGNQQHTVRSPRTRDYYFNHSFHVVPRTSDVSAGSFRWNGQEIVAAVSLRNICGVQFHPEKSQGQGLSLLRNFALTGELGL